MHIILYMEELSNKEEFKQVASCKQSRKCHWTEEQDRYLKQLSKMYGKKDWTIIADCMNKKFVITSLSSKQCRERFRKHLDPALEKAEWTEEENVKLLIQYKKLRNNWSEIAKVMPGRKNNTVKNKFYSIFRKIIKKIQKSDYKFGSDYEILQALFVCSMISYYTRPSIAGQIQKDFVFKLIDQVPLLQFNIFQEQVLKETQEITGELAGYIPEFKIFDTEPEEINLMCETQQMLDNFSMIYFINLE